MHDRDVRQLLLASVDRRYGDGDTRVVEELGVLSGDARVDVAAINGRLHGWEIKSDADTLLRLPRQIELYGQVFDHLTLVAGAHLDEAAELLPSWWGLWRVRPDGASLEEIRAAEQNPHVDGIAVAWLLWRDELLSELEARACDRGVRSASRSVLVQRLVEVTSPQELGEAVRSRLKARQSWRARPSHV